LLPPGTGQLLHAHLSHPLNSFILVSATVAALRLISLALAAPAGVLALLALTWQLCSLASGTWLLVHLQQLAASSWVRSHAGSSAVGPLTALASMAAKLTIAAASLVALHLAGAPLGPLLAFGSVGGIALGLATQVAASNVVAGACLLLARPFGLSDKIDLPGRGLAGWVTAFNIDHTTIAPDDSVPVHIPNAELAKLAIRNISRRKLWPIAVMLRLPHTALAQVPALLSDLEAYLRGRADFAEAPPRQECRAVLADIGPDALLIAISAFIAVQGPTGPVSLAAFERRRSDILCSIGRLVDKHGLRLQLPLQAEISYAGGPAMTGASRAAEAAVN